MILVRHLGRMAATLAVFTARSGRWWVPVVVVLLVVASILIVTIKTVLPVTVYTLL